jgi:hypothetical protein
MRREIANVRQLCSPDGAKRNPGPVDQRVDNPGLRFAPSGLRLKKCIDCPRQFCRAALQRKFLFRSPWDFHADALSHCGAHPIGLQGD